MAKIVIIKHRESGMMKEGLYGFSWTCLFFGFFVPLFRGDLIFAGLFFFLTSGSWFLFGYIPLLLHLIFAFLYNKQYMTRMFEKGWELADTDARNYEARAALNMTHNQTEADSRAGRTKTDSPTPTITS